MNWMSLVLLLVRTLGTKLPTAWPHILIIVEELKKVLLILNDGKPLTGTARGAAEVPTLVNVAVEAGVPQEQADEVARILQQVDEVTSE